MSRCCLDEEHAAVARLAERICLRLGEEIDKLGLSEQVAKPRWEEAQCRLRVDPALGDETLEMLWHGRRGERIGSILFHQDGSYFAEYDVVRPHPQKPRWFVEAVCAWGREQTIKAEPRLLPIPQ
jgi:hypothetical protein